MAANLGYLRDPMAYSSLEACLNDLEKHGHLLRIKEAVDPNLEMAAIHLRIYAEQGPALLFENVKGSRFRAASNLFGSLERSKFLFRDTLKDVQHIIHLKNNPAEAIKRPFAHIGAAKAALHALPLKNPLRKPVVYEEISISDLPQIKHWQMDGGAFVTLPQVYSEDVDHPGIMQANLGMYRIQLSGNDYVPDKEIGLHYQLHRGIGVHQTKARLRNQPLKVSCFVGGPPAHTLAAVMPLPEGISEMTFAGLLGGRRFRYTYIDGFCVSTDADFVITGTVYPEETKPEGPFGDHLGYYSLTHPFPVMRVHKVFARKDAIWPFTVVGRPPQEDTSFGALIHEISGSALKVEIPGLKEVNAVDAAGVHPLLLAIGSERYTPYAPTLQPAELLTIANHVLGTGQLSLAKFLFITAAQQNESVNTHDIAAYFHFVLSRIDWKRDVHFYTKTTIDTLDYSGTGLNTGSKVVFAAYGDPVRELGSDVPSVIQNTPAVKDARSIIPGVIAVSTGSFISYNDAAHQINNMASKWDKERGTLHNIALIVVCDDAAFTSATLNNFLWVSFTRCNPSHDIYGVGAFTEHKHWGCHGPLIIDARIKPHHAPALVVDPEVEKRIDRLWQPGGSVYEWYKKHKR
ncbi:UbiD family decarboxylase [Rurimicrobium arvi]